MFIAFESRKLTLPCKDCHQPVTGVEHRSVLAHSQSLLRLV